MADLGICGIDRVVDGLLPSESPPGDPGAGALISIVPE
jgi:hypothetical protein